MAKKVYAIKEGYDKTSNLKIENVVVDTWAECLKYTKGVKGAKYKSFEDIEAARAYLDDKSKLLKKDIDWYSDECLHLYVDGSYNTDTERYAYGVVAVRNNVIEYIDSASPQDTSKSKIRQIAGELEGALRAVEYALQNGDKEVVLFHDYEGIYHHATGGWERKDQSSEEYYRKMNDLINKGIKVTFVKVDSHTGDLYNELVDERCKRELNIGSDKTVEKWLRENKIYVIDNIVKQQILEIAESGEKNIIVKSESNHNPVDRFVKTIDIAEMINSIVIELPIEKQKEVLSYVQQLTIK